MGAPGVKRFEGKVAIVTASTAGIGLGIATRLGREGASVVISSRKKKNVDETVRKLKEEGIEAIGVVCHVGDASQRKNLIKEAVETYGRIDALISNAAVNPGVGPILDMPPDQLDKIFDINLKAAIYLVAEAAPHMPKGSAVVFVTSIAAYQPLAPLGVYGISKTAILGLTKALAVEMAPDVRVNGVAPGIVPTHFADALVSEPTQKKAMEDKTALQRLGTVDDMAAAVAFLASGDASYITGETIVVAGGMPSRL